MKSAKTLNEEETIALFWRILSHNKHARNSADPFSDDVAWIKNLRNSKFVVAKADMLVSDTDVPPRMSAKQIAFKAVTSTVSDFAAKGARPSYCIISLSIPKKNSTEDYLKSLATGFDSASKFYGVKIIAGDTGEDKGGLHIDVSGYGFSNRIVKRSGARPGELVGVSGPFGLQKSGLKILLENAKSPSESFEKRAVKSVLEPRARLSLGLKISNLLSSCTDSSDGLALSLYHLAESSLVEINLDKIPIADGVGEFADENDLDEDDLALFGGEEYELVMTYKKKNENRLRKYGIQTIGEVSRMKREPGVYYQSSKLERKGWIHNS